MAGVRTRYDSLEQAELEAYEMIRQKQAHLIQEMQRTIDAMNEEIKKLRDYAGVLEVKLGPLEWILEELVKERKRQGVRTTYLERSTGYGVETIKKFEAGEYTSHGLFEIYLRLFRDAFRRRVEL